jgi:hypothetical protein
LNLYSDELEKLLFFSLAIKTGRYTYAKKARDIMEVKGLKEQDLVTSKTRPARLGFKGSFRDADVRTSVSVRKKTIKSSAECR